MSLNIEYISCECGCIEAKFIGENSEYLLDISAVYDPFCDWFFALENIDRNYPPHIIINPEGAELQISLRDELCDFCFSITQISGFDKGKKVFICQTTREEIIEQMYVKLMAFVHSDKYNPNDYESNWGGFKLSTYHNATLDKYARFGIEPYYKREHCCFCGSKTHIFTIDDMLQRAYGIISTNDKLIKFLDSIGQSKESIGIYQNHSRFVEFLENEIKEVYDANFSNKFINPYRCVANPQNPIKLCFSEDFSVLECVEVEAMKIYTLYKDRADKMRFLVDFFACSVDFAPIIDECIEPNKHLSGDFLVLKKDGKAIKDNESTAIYPNRNNAYFAFERAKKNSAMINNISLRLAQCKPLNAPLSMWLNQKVIRIMPDFSCYLWNNAGVGIDLDSLEGYENLHESNLGKALDLWGNEFDKSATNKDFDWESFNKKGVKLWKELQELVKYRYIVLYEKSFEEEFGFGW